MDMKVADYESITRLPVLDSFIKESSRLNPLDKSMLSLKVNRQRMVTLTDLVVAIRRKALRPYTFSNGGPHVAAGEMACVSGWDLMHDSAKYPNPDDFDGLRFVKPSVLTPAVVEEQSMRGTSLTDATKDFPIWGLGSKAWCVVRQAESLIPSTDNPSAQSWQVACGPRY